MIRKILPQIICNITQHPREQMIVGVDFQWSQKSLTHNLFRLYELIFWRRSGIRLEISSATDGERCWQVAHSFEGAVALAEYSLREVFSFRFKPVRIWIPIMQTPQGIPIFTSPYLFAIAFDAKGSASIGGAGPYTWTNTCTGSNLLLVAGARPNTSTSGVTATKGSSATAMTQLGTADIVFLCSFWYIVSPDTGVGSNIVATCPAAGGFNGRSASYTGAAQTGVPDSQAQATGVAQTSTTPTTTVVASNCWLTCIANNDQANPTPGGGTTVRTSADGDTICICDSNGTVGTGSQSLSLTHPSASTAYNVISFAPTGGGGAAVTVVPTLLLMGTG